MSNYEGFKSRRTVNSFGTTMTAAMRNGDFSAVPTQLQDPLSRVEDRHQRYRQRRSRATRFPATRFNKGSLLLLDKFCAAAESARRPGCPIATTSTWPRLRWTRTSSPGASISTRAPKSQWFGRYSWTDELTITPGIKLNGQPLYTRASQWVLSNTRVLLLDQGERGPLRLQLAVQQHQPGTGRHGERQCGARHAGQDHGSELLGHPEHLAQPTI